jgi:TRAP-type C4-dicarboxylate transport system substrate-binding protein
MVRWLLPFLVLAIAAPRAHADERRIATLAPEGSLWMKQLRRGAALIEKHTDGRVVTKYYSGGTQGGEKDVVRKMGIGQLDGAALTSIGLALIYPGIRVLQLPGFYQSTSEIDYVRLKMWPHFREKFRARGYELLAPGDIGWIYLFSTVAVRTEAELKRLKIWRWDGDPLSRDLFAAVGLRGIPLSVPEVLTAFNTRKIEAAFASPLAAVALQWHTKVRFMAAAPVGYGVGAMVMRTEVWNRASDADKKVQTKIGRKMAIKTVQRVRRDNDRALAAIKRSGVVVIPPRPDMERELDRNAEAMRSRWVGKLYSQRELDLVVQYRAEYRAKHPGERGDRGVVK